LTSSHRKAVPIEIIGCMYLAYVCLVDGGAPDELFDEALMFVAFRTKEGDTHIIARRRGALRALSASNQDNRCVSKAVDVPIKRALPG